MKNPTENKTKFLSKRRIIRYFLVVFLILSSFILTANIIVKQSAKNLTFNDAESIESNEVGVILGTSKYKIKGGINPYFKNRVDAAFELFIQEKIKFILVSGDNSTQYYNEPKTIKDELLKLGVPENKIFLDYAGFRTLDSVIRAKKVFGQSKFTVISQKFHNERAIYLAKHHGVEAIGYNAKDVSIGFGLKTQIREYFARTKAVIDIILNTKPKYLGDKIEIK